MRRILGILLIIFLLLQSLSLTVFAQEESCCPEYNTDEENIIQTSSEQQDLNSVIKWLLRTRVGSFGRFPMLYTGKFFVFQFMPPQPIQASPAAITLNYNEEAYFDVGGVDPDTGEWIRVIQLAVGGYSWGWMNQKIAFYFEVVPFENMDVWNIQFDPPRIELYPSKQHLNWPGADNLFKTNVSIRLNPDVADPTMYTQDIVLKINVWREQTLDITSILGGAPDYAFPRSPDFEEYLQKDKEIGVIPYYESLYNRISMQTIARFTVANMNRVYPPYYELLDSVVEVLIKVNRYHQLDLRAPETVEIQPYEVKSIPVYIQNIGSHIDTFNFRAKSDNEDIIIVAPPALTLQPGEIGEALVGVAAPKTLYALGEISNINVEAFSVYNPEQIFLNTVTLKTTGVYATGAPTINLFLIVFTLIVALVMIKYILIIIKAKRKTQEIKIKSQEKIFDKKRKDDKEKKEKKRKESIKKEEIETVEKKGFKDVFSNFFKGFKTDKRKMRKDGLETSSINNEEVETVEKKEFKDVFSNFFKGFKLDKEKKRKEELETSSVKKEEEKDSFSSKAVIVLKKWFTVPEEEKHRKHVEPVKPKEKQVDSMEKEDQVAEISTDHENKDEHAYDQVIKRIEEEQKRKQAQKAQHQKELEKQKAINRVKKAQKKQRKKLKRNLFTGVQG